MTTYSKGAPFYNAISSTMVLCFTCGRLTRHHCDQPNRIPASGGGIARLRWMHCRRLRRWNRRPFFRRGIGIRPRVRSAGTCCVRRRDSGCRDWPGGRSSYLLRHPTWPSVTEGLGNAHRSRLHYRIRHFSAFGRRNAPYHASCDDHRGICSRIQALAQRVTTTPYSNR